MRRATLVIALVLMLGMLAACGGDDSDSDDPTEAATSEQSASTPTEQVTQATSTEPEDATTSTGTSEEAAATGTEEDETATASGDQATSADATGTEASGEPRIVEPEPRSDEIARDGRFLGDPDAPVVLTEFGDFQ